MSQISSKIRNIAIIAHVDHGKTTLVDWLLKQSKTFDSHQAEMAQELLMDSGDQEKERGITITAKVTAVQYGDHRINIIDTPGHADFGGEVERTLSMADGCLLIVDAQEGPMPQTKFVLTQALAKELKPIVVINKIDKPGGRVAEVVEEVADLFLELAVHEDQLHYPVYYAVGREGKAWNSVPESPGADGDLEILFKAIIDEIPAPQVKADSPLQMMVSALSFDSYKGKYAIGRISSGAVKAGDMVAICKKDGSTPKVRVGSVFMSKGLGKFEVPGGVAGDIVQLTGLGNIQIGETVADANHPVALPSLEVEAPTLQIYMGPNTSPVKGTEGEFVTGQQIGSRLKQELETNIGLRVEDHGLGYLVSGRGELHLSVLIETMRREGFELEVGRPQVVTREVDGKIEEPVEELIVEVPSEHTGAVQMELSKRRASLNEQFSVGENTKLIYELPTRALLGLRTILLTNTKGTAVMNSIITGYQPLGPALKQLRNGVLIAYETGITTPFALQNAQQRGTTFVGPAQKVYAGQIVGLSSRGDDLEVNVCKGKHLTNMRSSSSDGVVQLTPPTILSLEECLDFIENDELVEVTPKSLRLRKRELDANVRKKQAKNLALK
jgi:GTP-binding protein